MIITNELRDEIELEDIVNYDALPCHLKGMYYINGVPLSESEFGHGYDDGDDDDDDVCEDVTRWGCIHRVFKRYTDDKSVNATMDIYDITREEFDLIADRLEELLYVGECGWCI